MVSILCWPYGQHINYTILANSPCVRNDANLQVLAINVDLTANIYVYGHYYVGYTAPPITVFMLAVRPTH